MFRLGFQGLPGCLRDKEGSYSDELFRRDGYTTEKGCGYILARTWSARIGTRKDAQTRKMC